MRASVGILAKMVFVFGLDNWMFPIVARVMFVSLLATSSNAWAVQRLAVPAKRLLATASQVPSGLCPVYKPRDWTSSDVVQRCRAVLEKGIAQKGKRARVKVGHGGTLDPDAEGVLVLGIGEGTKQLAEYLSGTKRYFAGGLLGKATNTFDATGNVTEESAWRHVTEQLLEQALKQFEGTIMQTPPMFSALKVNGKRLYDLARQGQVLELQPREVVIDKIELQRPVALPQFHISVECGGGVYIRSLISDIGKACGTHAHMTSLVREKQGVFGVDDCLRVEHWTFDELCSHTRNANEKLQSTEPNATPIQ